MPITLSAVLSFIGLAFIIPLVILNLLRLKKQGWHSDALLPLGISVFYGIVAAIRLIRQSHGLYCVQSTFTTLILYGLPLLIFAYFLWDVIYNLRNRKKAVG